MKIDELDNKNKDELLELAQEMGISDSTGLKKQDIIMRLLKAHTEKEGHIFCNGVLEIMSDGRILCCPARLMYIPPRLRSAALVCATVIWLPGRAGHPKVTRNTTVCYR